MIKQYLGKKGKERLKSAILNLQVVEHDKKIANAILKKSSLIQFTLGSTVILQGGTDTDVYFIIAGTIKVFIKNRTIGIRGPSEHIGEMAAIDPHQRRSASCIAIEPTVCLKITERDFLSIVNKYPDAWRRVALVLANRLRYRSNFIVEPNPIPHIFIGTSKESLSVGKFLEKSLYDERRQIVLWNKGIFETSKTCIESLVLMVQKYDFGIIVFNRDDIVFSRGKKKYAPRDNVIFELGLLIGALGRDRVIVLFPKGVSLKIPSDLLGVTFLDFTKNNLKNRCSEISNVINRLWSK